MLYLQVTWQCQERSVQLALVNACAVPYALHPQAFHVCGDCDDVGAHVCCAAPVGKQSCNQSSCKSQKPQEEAEELSCHAGHALLTHSDRRSNCKTQRLQGNQSYLCVTYFAEAAHKCTLDPQIEHRNNILPHAKKDHFKSKAAVPPEAEDQAGFLLSALSPVNSTEHTSSHRV